MERRKGKRCEIVARPPLEKAENVLTGSPVVKGDTTLVVLPQIRSESPVVGIGGGWLKWRSGGNNGPFKVRCRVYGIVTA